jgi:elongation of very long chain fatty acids protein 4
MNLNVFYDGDVYLTVVLNGLIHTIMYTYYFVSLHSKDIWWKSVLTLCQIIQFVVMNSQAFYLIWIGCQHAPIFILKFYLFYILTLLVLFTQFFIASYSTKGGKKSKKRVTEKSE